MKTNILYIIKGRCFYRFPHHHTEELSFGEYKTLEEAELVMSNLTNEGDFKIEKVYRKRNIS